MIRALSIGLSDWTSSSSESAEVGGGVEGAAEDGSGAVEDTVVGGDEEPVGAGAGT